MAGLDTEADLVHLSVFEEISGSLQSVYQDAGFLYVELSAGILRFPAGSTEARICRRELPEESSDTISILRLPDQERPIAIRC
jgi:hypothetical protein